MTPEPLSDYAHFKALPAEERDALGFKQWRCEQQGTADTARIDWLEASGAISIMRYRNGPNGPLMIDVEDGRSDTGASAKTLRDAIDELMNQERQRKSAASP